MRRPLLLFFVASLSTYASLASAADPKNVKEADRRFKEGTQLMAAGRVDDARVRFAEANALVRSTDILWNLIGAEFQSNHFADALNHARQFVRDPKATPKDVAYINSKIIPDASQQVGQIEVDAPAGSQVEVDSKEKAGHAPLLDPFAVAPGAHEIIAITPTERLTKDVTVTAGQTVRVTLGAAPVAVAPVAPSASAGLDVTSMMDRSPDATTHAAEDDSDASSRRSKRYWLTGGFATGAVLLAAGSITFFAMAKSADDDVSAAQARHPAGTCPASGCSDLDDALDSRRSRAITAYALAGGAVLAAVGAGISWWVLRPHESSTKASALELIPTFGPGHSGLLLRSSF